MALEQHAIPTEVTTYEFRLVGDMTLKQFGWLAGGILLAIFTYIAIPLFIIKWPLIFIFAFGGAAIAFVPYEGRTLDRWLIAFFKAVYMPTEFVWHKEQRIPDYFQTVKRLPDFKPQSNITNLEQAQVQNFVDTLPLLTATNSSDQAELQQLNQIRSLYAPADSLPNPTQTPSTDLQLIDPLNLDSALPPQPETQFTSDILKSPDSPIGQTSSARIISETTNAQSSHLPLTNTQPTEPQINPQADQQQLSEVAHQIEQQLDIQPDQFTEQAPSATNSFSTALDLDPQLQSAMAAPTQNLPDISDFTALKPTDTNSFTNSAGLPANIISGTVVDPNQQPVHQAIVEIIDHHGFPVRALKTDINGHFQIATPIVSGPYTLKLEKSGYQIPPQNFQANDNPIPPFNLIATPAN